MPIFAGGGNVSKIYIGATEVKSVYAGSTLVWTGEEPWDFVDDFERSTIGTDWTGSGGLIAGTAPNRHLKKNSSAGSSDYWTVRQFDTDDIEVRTVLGPVDSGDIRAAIIIGNPSGQYVYVEFQANGGTLSYYNGSQWVQFSPVSAKPGGYTQGDVVVLKRTGTLVEFIVNGTVLASGATTVGRGPGSRRVALSVRSLTQLFIPRYGPTYDEVRIRAN